jgi:hypothetical protein
MRKAFSRGDMQCWALHAMHGVPLLGPASHPRGEHACSIIRAFIVDFVHCNALYVIMLLY